MKKYAAKVLANHPDLSSGHIFVINTDSDPETILKQISPDAIASGEGTQESPYVYTPTVELIGELQKDADGEYITPDRSYRDKWRDKGDGTIELAASDKLEVDRASMLEEIRKCREEKYAKADVQLLMHTDSDPSAVGTEAAWKTYRIALRNITETYKDGSGQPTAAIDAVSDAETDVNWPAEPT